ncbi:MAG: spore coat protein CotJB [Muricoprocola sp.]
MAEQEHLSIASVPFQSWGELYEQAQALSIGTIFRELDKPFFASEEEFGNIPGSCPSQRPGDPEEYRENAKEQSTGQQRNECMMLQIMEISFMMDDIRLYLDTHPEDKDGLQLLKQVIQRRKQLMKDFAEKHFPLTMDCMADLYEKNPESDCYCWQKGKVPWEGVCV